MWRILYLDIIWCLRMEVNIQHRVKWFCEKASLKICYGILCESRSLNVKNWWLNLLGKCWIFHSTTNFVVLCGENMISEKLKIVWSVTVSRLEEQTLVIVPIWDQLQPNFYKLPCVEQRIAKLDLKSTMYSVVKCP